MKSEKIIKIPTYFLVMLTSFVLAACSTTGSGVSAGPNDTAAIEDPFESFNRGMLSVNNAIDDVALAPIARGYRAITPVFVRTGVQNFYRNLRTPVNAANQLLQGDVEGFAGDVTRLGVNTVFGIGGLIDVAKDAGIPYEQEDFGQTLAVWGVGHGPYMMLPLIGPSSVRDGTGMAVDMLADPVRIYLHNTDRDGAAIALLGGKVVSERERLLDALEDLRKNSFDYYAALRSAYVQNRGALVDDQSTKSGAAIAVPGEADHP